METILIATRNAGKLKEIRDLLVSFPYNMVGQCEYGCDIEVEENGTTFEENALLKARTIAAATGMPTIADDSGLCVDALDGAPGIYTARYAGEGATDDDRMAKLLNAMRDVPREKRTAYFVSVIAFSDGKGEEFVCRGECHGLIADKKYGDGGFGYDPIFYYPPLGRTFGELPDDAKDRISHRANAMKVFFERFAKYADK